jgi:hypothetical protein
MLPPAYLRAALIALAAVVLTNRVSFVRNLTGPAT